MPTITYTYTNAGHNLLRDGTEGASNPKVLYVALGTDSTAPAVTNTKLGAEAFRKAISTYTNGANPGEIIFSGYISQTDAVGINVAEVGWFGGSSAGTSANTGVLLARGLYSPAHVKTNGESIQVTLDLTI